MTGKAIEVFGDDRKRSILYVKDLVRVIFDLYSHRQSGFRAYNLAGNNVGIYDLAKMICTLTGSGSVIKKELPHEVKTIDIGNAVFNDDLIRGDLGDIQFTPLETALNNTINYYKGRLLLIWRCDLLPQYEKYKAEIDGAISRVLHSGRYTLAQRSSSVRGGICRLSGCKACSKCCKCY